MDPEVLPSLSGAKRWKRRGEIARLMRLTFESEIS